MSRIELSVARAGGNRPNWLPGRRSSALTAARTMRSLIRSFVAMGTRALGLECQLPRKRTHAGAAARYPFHRQPLRSFPAGVCPSCAGAIQTTARREIPALARLRRDRAVDG